MTANERLRLAKTCTVIECYGPVTAYYNKYGERIQDWDEYGKKNAVRQGTAEGLVLTAVGSDKNSALETVDRYIEAGNQVDKILILNEEATIQHYHKGLRSPDI